LQFEAMLAATHDSNNPYDFALVCSAYSGCGSPKRPPWTSPTSAKSTDLGEEHRHRVLRVIGKGHNIVLVPMPPAEHARSTAPSATAAPGRSC
jgi:integrase/recombinase XerD